MRSISRRALERWVGEGKRGSSSRLVVSPSGTDIRLANRGETEEERRGDNDAPGHQMVLQQASLCPHWQEMDRWGPDCYPIIAGLYTHTLTHTHMCARVLICKRQCVLHLGHSKRTSHRSGQISSSPFQNLPRVQFGRMSIHVVAPRLPYWQFFLVFFLVIFFWRSARWVALITQNQQTSKDRPDILNSLIV